MLYHVSDDPEQTLAYMKTYTFDRTGVIFKNI